MKKMHIGIDFDNTIVCYDEVFYKAALEKKLIRPDFPSTKTQIRDYFRANRREDEWTELQGYVYGARMELARPFPAFEDFIVFCKDQEIKVSIISHKTKHPYLGPRYDLHQTARSWLSQQRFYSNPIDTYFEVTLQEKLNRIKEAKCDIFIDDLPELLDEESFPKNVKKILFDPSNLYPLNSKWQTLASWESMPSILKSCMTC